MYAAAEQVNKKPRSRITDRIASNCIFKASLPGKEYLKYREQE
jgi:hypothetical protein